MPAADCSLIYFRISGVMSALRAFGIYSNINAPVVMGRVSNKHLESSILPRGTTAKLTVLTSKSVVITLRIPLSRLLPFLALITSEVLFFLLYEVPFNCN